MKVYQNLRLSIKALLLNKSRTWFSVAGMAIGIAAVIITVAIGEAAKEKALKPLKDMGTNVISINAGKFTEVFGRAREVTSVTTLKLLDINDLTNVTSINRMSAFQETMLQVGYQAKSTNSLVQGVTADYPIIRNYTLNSGSFFTFDHNLHSDRVAVLGSQMAEKFFKNKNVLGEVILINKIPFIIIGVLNPKGSAADLGNIDNVIMIPNKTLLRRVLNIDYLSKIYIQVNDQNDMGKVENEIVTTLRNNHKLEELGKENDFTVINQLNAIRTTNETSKSFNYLILGVAAISLIIGGVGILAVMILSVRERIREIGLRISIGARKWHILFQFLSESFLLGSVGGITGVVVGCLTAFLLNRFSSWETLINVDAIIISLAFSMITGVMFGVYPAYRASNFNPIKALKSE